jgi:hypothetical protein
MVQQPTFAPGFFDEARVVGPLLVLSFISFGVGATVPLLGKKANPRFVNLPMRDLVYAESASSPSALTVFPCFCQGSSRRGPAGARSCSPAPC